MRIVNLEAIYKYCKNADQTEKYWLQKAVMQIYWQGKKDTGWYSLQDAWRFVKGYFYGRKVNYIMPNKLSHNAYYGYNFPNNGRYVGD